MFYGLTVFSRCRTETVLREFFGKYTLHRTTHRQLSVTKEVTNNDGKDVF